MAAEKVAVFLTKYEVATLRGLVVREAQRLGHGTHQRASDEPSALKRLKPVAKKIWEAHQHFAEQTDASR